MLDGVAIEQHLIARLKHVSNPFGVLTYSWWLELPTVAFVALSSFAGRRHK
jgi:hypothetical protein